MIREAAEIPDDRAALRFAAGCLRAAAGMAIAARLRSAWAAARSLLFPPAPSTRRSSTMNFISARPRLLGLLCGAGAVGIGMAYMLAAGAPPRYLLVNLAALVLGATAWLALGRAGRSPLAGAGIATLALSLPLLLTALFGVAAEGASRWVSVGPLTLQVSLIAVPLMIVLYARRPDSLGTAGMAVAALALAIQPDRAMAGVLLAGLVALPLAVPGRLPIVAASASALAFAWTLLTPDALQATSFVDRVFYASFDVHPLAGAAVVIGAAALLLPGILGLLKGEGDRAVLLAFVGCWSAVVAAAALGNYPTPVVGYGGSAVLGYLLSVALLPGAARDAAGQAAADSTSPAVRGSDQTISELHVARQA
jgi:cell division protein FtsW (lipid II flippase)